MDILLATTNSFIRSYAQSDGFGKCIFIALFCLSILSWIIIIHKLWLTSKMRSISQDFAKAFESQKKHLFDIKWTTPLNSQIPNPYHNIYKAVKQKTRELLEKNRFFLNNSEIYLSDSDISLVEAYISSEIADQTKVLEKNLYVLATIKTLAPFLGLLGTAWGILVTFSGLQTHSLMNANTTVLSGLSMALATTVLGLLVAIPSLVAYSYLKNSSKNFAKDLENFSQSLLTSVEIQYRKVTLG